MRTEIYNSMIDRIEKEHYQSTPDINDDNYKNKLLHNDIEALASYLRLTLAVINDLLSERDKEAVISILNSSIDKLNPTPEFKYAKHREIAMGTIFDILINNMCSNKRKDSFINEMHKLKS